jgi:hypothetical protein
MGGWTPEASTRSGRFPRPGQQKAADEARELERESGWRRLLADSDSNGLSQKTPPGGAHIQFFGVGSGNVVRERSGDEPGQGLREGKTLRGEGLNTFSMRTFGR